MKLSDTGPNGSKRAGVTMDAEGETKFVMNVRKMYQQDIDADFHNIQPAREDIKFVIGDQWDEATKARRNRLMKPVLTVNRLPAFVAQFLGSWQQTDTTMKLVPLKGGSKMTAEIRQGMIRSVVKEARGKHAINMAMTTAYICGVGNFGIELRDTKYDVFTKEIQLVPFEDPFQVIWDRSSREPTGADANHCFAMQFMTKEDFQKAYPNAKSVSGWFSDDMDETVMTAHGWEVDEMIRVCHFWQMKEENVTLALEGDSGDIIDVTDWSDDERNAKVAIDQKGALIIRDTVRPYAECYVLSGQEVLDGPFRLNVMRLPIFRVEGWVLQEAAVRYRWGFVRNSKDPQRLHNYWRSILAEELMKSVSSKWLLDQAAMKSGLADHFRKAHLTGDNVLFWDSQSDGAKPEFIEPPRINQAVLTEAQMSVQDIKDVTNKHEASMGVTSNEVSGKAINARQRVSELGDRIYLENMNLALMESAMTINELIPEVYDTNRAVKLMGEDDQVTIQEINGDFGDETPDIKKGRYEITSKTGPSYATKREEAVETMLTLMNHMPQTGNYIADIIARNMDIPGADEISERLMALLPPGMVDPKHMPEAKRAEFLQRQEAAQEQQQMDQQIQMQMMQKNFEKLSAEIQDIQARAMKSEAQAELALSQVGVDAFEAQTEKELGAEKNIIQAGAIGAQLDTNDIKRAQLGVDSAFKTAEIMDRVDERRSAAKKEQTNGEKDSKSTE